jgi:hypothetical protein
MLGRIVDTNARLHNRVWWLVVAGITARVAGLLQLGDRLRAAERIRRGRWTRQTSRCCMPSGLASPACSGIVQQLYVSGQPIAEHERLDAPVGDSTRPNQPATRLAARPAPPPASGINLCAVASGHRLIVWLFAQHHDRRRRPWSAPPTLPLTQAGYGVPAPPGAGGDSRREQGFSPVVWA